MPPRPRACNLQAIRASHMHAKRAFVATFWPSTAATAEMAPDGGSRNSYQRYSHAQLCLLKGSLGCRAWHLFKYPEVLFMGNKAAVPFNVFYGILLRAHGIRQKTRVDLDVLGRCFSNAADVDTRGAGFTLKRTPINTAFVKRVVPGYASKSNTLAKVAALVNPFEEGPLAKVPKALEFTWPDGRTATMEDLVLALEFILHSLEQQWEQQQEQEQQQPQPTTGAATGAGSATGVTTRRKAAVLAASSTGCMTRTISSVAGTAGPLPAPHDTKHDAADATWPRILPSSVHPERLGAHLASSHGTLGEAGVDLGELLAGLDCITSGAAAGSGTSSRPVGKIAGSPVSFFMSADPAGVSSAAGGADLERPDCMEIPVAGFHPALSAKRTPAGGSGHPPASSPPASDAWGAEGINLQDVDALPRSRRSDAGAGVFSRNVDKTGSGLKYFPTAGGAAAAGAADTGFNLGLPRLIDIPKPSTTPARPAIMPGAASSARLLAISSPAEGRGAVEVSDLLELDAMMRSKRSDACNEGRSMGRDAGFHVSSFKAAGAADAGADLGLPGLTGTPSLISTPALLTTPSPAAHPSCPKPSSSFSDGSWGVQAGNQQDLGDSLDYSDSGRASLQISTHTGPQARSAIGHSQLHHPWAPSPAAYAAAAASEPPVFGLGAGYDKAAGRGQHSSSSAGLGRGGVEWSGSVCSAAARGQDALGLRSSSPGSSSHSRGAPHDVDKGHDAVSSMPSSEDSDEDEPGSFQWGLADQTIPAPERHRVLTADGAAPAAAVGFTGGADAGEPLRRAAPQLALAAGTDAAAVHGAAAGAPSAAAAGRTSLGAGAPFGPPSGSNTPGATGRPLTRRIKLTKAQLAAGQARLQQQSTRAANRLAVKAPRLKPPLNPQSQAYKQRELLRKCILEGIAEYSRNKATQAEVSAGALLQTGRSHGYSSSCGSSEAKRSPGSNAHQRDSSGWDRGGCSDMSGAFGSVFSGGDSKDVECGEHSSASCQRDSDPASEGQLHGDSSGHVSDGDHGSGPAMGSCTSPGGKYSHAASTEGGGDTGDDYLTSPGGVGSDAPDPEAGDGSSESYSSPGAEEGYVSGSEGGGDTGDDYLTSPGGVGSDAPDPEAGDGGSESYSSPGAEQGYVSGSEGGGDTGDDYLTSPGGVGSDAPDPEAGDGSSESYSSPGAEEGYVSGSEGGGDTGDDYLTSPGERSSYVSESEG